MLKDTIIYVVKHLTTHPDAVALEELGNSFKLTVHRDDTGKVIGKDGQSIKAIRSLVSLFSKDGSVPDVVIDS